ncbi:hypothetical protein [Thiolapillus sp.]
MSVVDSASIEEPRLVVAPAAWLFMGALALLFTAFLLVVFLPMGSEPLKGPIVLVSGLVLIGVTRNYFRGDYLATMQANAQGLYFQTDHPHRYFYLPWEYVGSLEATSFSLNSRGLRVEVLGDYRDRLVRSRQVGNVRTENGRTYVYTLPRLRDREQLIQQLENFRKGA